MNGKTAIVTGGSRGIGKAIAQTLAQAGARVMVWSTSAEGAEASAASLAAVTGAAVTGVAVNVTDAAAIDAAIKSAQKEYGGIDIFVNNAGITRDGLLVRMKEEDWDAVLDVNLKGAFLCTKSVGRYMCKARSGVIINIASIIGQLGNAGQANYAASKAGLFGLTKSSAREFAPRGVRVNAIAPGYIVTDMTGDMDEAQQAELLSTIPLGRLGSVEDIAAAVLYLAGDSGRYVTGQVLSVNGGMAM